MESTDDLGSSALSVKDTQQSQPPEPAKAAAYIKPLVQAADTRGTQHAASEAVSAPDTDGPALRRADSSIYDIRSKHKQNIILFAAAVAAILVPFTDTVYLPALGVIGKDLSADAGLVAASVSIYMIAVGIGSLFWGPMADRFGRRLAYVIGSIIFLGTTIGCIFAPNIGVLVAFRALQGWAVAAYQTTGQGVIADVFAPAVRGFALGLFSIPLLVGPLAGPLLGGILSQAFGWRSTFICLAVFVGALAFPLLMVAIPETHQYRVVKSMSKKNLAAAAAIAESEIILRQKPMFQAPWVPLKYLLEPEITVYALLLMSTFGCMFASLTEWPARLAAPPYSLSEGMIGVSYLAMGVAGLVGSPLGGGMSDVTAARFPQIPDARLLFNIAAALILMPIGLIIYAWTLHHSTHIVGPLAGHFVIGVASASYLPGLFGYISTIKQQNASGAAAAMHAVMFIMSGVLISVSVAAVHGMGFGPYFSKLAGIQLLLACLAAYKLHQRFKALGGGTEVAVADTAGAV